MQGFKSMLAVFGIVCAAASAVSAAPAASAARPIVGTTQGRVAGATTDGVTAFLGIPYAAAPVGARRWRDPAPASAWSGVRDATRFGPGCYQALPAAFGPYTGEFLNGAPMSEDCLSLNVWTPSQGGRRLPVYVYIHGGGFGTGASSVPIYNGAHLARNGVVVVTINYRLGVFGFLAHPDLDKESVNGTSGNYGVLDMIAALRWVRGNIARFGGDAGNVTIAGQSAGAAAVNDLIASPLATGLFQRAVAESGSGMGIDMVPLAKAEGYGTALAAKVQAASADAMRALSAEALVEASKVPPPAPGAKPGLPPILFAPNLDGKVIASDPNRPEQRPASLVPLVTGFNRDEGAIFGLQPVAIDNFVAEVRSRYGAFADRFLTLYPHATVWEATQSAHDMARDRFMASLVIWSGRRAEATGQKIYPYIFTHAYPGAEAARYGAFHTAEVPYVFGTLDVPGPAFTARDKAVSDQMQGYWLRFMQTGAPGGAGAALWQPATPGTETVMELGDRPGETSAVTTSERLRLFRAYAASGGRLSLF